MSDKPVDKSVVVLHRIHPLAGRFDDARKVSEEWLEFLKKIPGFTGSDTICCIDSQIAWLESWDSKMSVDKFNAEHIIFADYFARMMDCSRGVFVRSVYRKMF